MARLPLLLLAVVLIGSFAFHGYRAEHPTFSYQSADERSYGKLAINIAEDHHFGDGSTNMRDPLHWPPGAPMLFAAGHKVFPSADSERSCSSAHRGASRSPSRGRRCCGRDGPRWPRSRPPSVGHDGARSASVGPR